jgi:hypothetical protein
VSLEEARPLTELKKDKVAWKRKNIEPLRKCGFKKVSIDPIGRIWPNNE